MNYEVRPKVKKIVLSACLTNDFDNQTDIK